LDITGSCVYPAVLRPFNIWH